MQIGEVINGFNFTKLMPYWVRVSNEYSLSLEMESASPEKTVSNGVGAADANEQSHLSEEAVNNQSTTRTPEPIEGKMPQWL